MLENLRILRAEAKMTQKQLAEAIGVSQQSINKYENHNIEPDIETLIRIADHFDTSVDYLIGHKVSEQNTTQTDMLQIDERRLLSNYRSLTKTQKQALLQLTAAIQNQDI